MSYHLQQLQEKLPRFPDAPKLPLINIQHVTMWNLHLLFISFINKNFIFLSHKHYHRFLWQYYSDISSMASIFLFLQDCINLKKSQTNFYYENIAYNNKFQCWLLSKKWYFCKLSSGETIHSITFLVGSMKACIQITILYYLNLM